MFKATLEKTVESEVIVEAATEKEAMEMLERGEYADTGDEALVDLVILNVRELKEKC